MPNNTREVILARLKSAGRNAVAPRPAMPTPREMSMDSTQLKELFATQVSAQGGVVYPVADREALCGQLTGIFRQEEVKQVMAANDSILSPMGLREWGRRIGIEIVSPSDFQDRDAYTRTLFDQVGMGITGVDYAVAESGTLVLVHDKDQARLVSLAPLVHVAIVPTHRIVPVYETAVEAIYADGRRPSQVTLITGPSMTADIQGTPFKGMHGPQKLLVLLMD